MKLKTIELVGFKSFAKKSKLDFSAPVVGVVGPNGSGKSNIVEAFRFVLGEQSMKSLRGKTGADLIFKGSKDLPKGSRASVEITFDNKDRVFKMSDRSEPLNLDFNEIVLKREVYPDGANTYSINGTSVRLKDIVELLASVNIGASGHHIISQGQADRILTSSAKDRRTMIEDALGLKVYQYKLKDAGKKLEKSEENMKEVGLVRRELAPHIKYLKKQVEKIEKGAELRSELSALYVSYFKSEESYLMSEDAALKTFRSGSERELKEIEVKLAAMKTAQHDPQDEKHTSEIRGIQNEITALERTKEELSRKLGRIEGMIEMATRQSGGPQSVSIQSDEFDAFVADLNTTVEHSLADESLERVRDNLQHIRALLDTFSRKFRTSSHGAEQHMGAKDLETTKRDIAVQIEEIEKARVALLEKVSTLRSAIEEARQNAFKDQEERFTLENRRSKLQAEEEVAQERLKNFTIRKANFENDMREAVALVGHGILSYKNAEGAPRATDEEARRMIERLKIRLEDIGTGTGEDVMKEYREVSERDEFLAKELEDLSKGIQNLTTLIGELKETLDREFKEGLEKINSRFSEFFTQMFGGGSAYLSSIVEQKRAHSGEEGEEDEVVATDNLDYGIEINVTLPQKKVKDLHMLSGGERSLTSIALVFAMTQVNPPPFLVLDETDAALDEANSRRYGDMIAILSKYSNLITVTHNRETMSRAGVIYGVTIGADGGSKLLSIKFDEAENYAK